MLAHDGYNVSLVDVDFSNNVNGIAVGHDGLIMHTSDAGVTWEKLESPTTSSLAGVDFFNPTTGIITGTDGMVLLTTDGGYHWEERSSGTSESLLDIAYSNDHSATAVGTHGTIVRTTDGGSTWEKQRSWTSHTLNRVIFSNDFTGTVVGENGTILRTTTGGVTWIEDTHTSPTLFHLAQNYPNPVTASTTIPFTLSRNDHVRLSVCDVLGREVAVLVDGIRATGLQSVPFNAAGLRTGIYFSVLRTTTGVETRKMLVINNPNSF
ncbi:T9SS type A sorting domain-containing protein [bacterium]|nr:T9SS type A sorting domain-containing protein [bacterium]